MKRFIALLLMMPVVVAHGQDQAPPSPNAAALGKYGQIPVGLFTGTAQVNIPLWEFKSGELQLPISLNYSSNGIKVDEIASNVGLGWVLDAGGVVARTVMDDADSDMRLQKPDGPFRSEEMLAFLKNLTNENGGDGEPDIYSFNFGIYSGKFYVDANNEAILIDPSPIVIEFLPASTEGEPKIKITDPFGVIYWFGGGNANETSIYRDRGAAGIPPVISETAWYLSLIEHPSGDKIHLEYRRKSVFYNTSLSQSVLRLVDSEIIFSENEKASCPQGSGTYAPPVVHTVRTVTSLLDNIHSSKEGRIKFSYSPYIDNLSFEKLDKISVFNNGESLIREFHFNYLIAKSEAFKNNDVKTATQEIDKKRLFLNSVREVGSDGRAAPPYLMEYYSPNELPARLSYAQDHWGYFNGKDNKYLVSKNVRPFYSTKHVYEDVIAYVFQNVGGDKAADGRFGVKGMLKKITYPTGGTNEFEYEPHSYYGDKIVLPPKKMESVNVQTKSMGLGINSDIYTIQHVYFDHQVRLYLSNVSHDTRPEDCNIPGYPTHKLKGICRVTDLTTNTAVDLYQVSSNTTSAVKVGASIQLTQNAPQRHIFFNAQKDKSYNVELRLSFECQTAGVTFEFYDQDVTIVKENLEVGGVRIAKVASDDGFGNRLVKRYQYGTQECADCSSGKIEPIRAAVTVSINEKNLSSERSTCKYATLMSNTFYPLYTSQGYHIGYPSVIESDGENFENGRIRHLFNIVPDAPANIFNGDMIPGTPLTNNFGNGQELKAIYETKNPEGSGEDFRVVRVIENKYKHDPRRDHEIYGYKANLFISSTQRLLIPGTPGGPPIETEATDLKPEMYDLTAYRISSQWHYPEWTLTTDFDQSGRKLENLVSYVYNNPDHLQVSATATTDSEGNTVIENIRYPHDYGSVENLKTLREKNMAGLPVHSEKIVDGHVVEGEVMKYNDRGQAIQVYNFESSDLVPVTEHDPGKVIPSDHYQLQTLIAYDESGLMKEVQYNSEPPVAYVWGYSNSKIIAYALNASSENIYYNGFEQAGATENFRSGRRAHAGSSFTIPAIDFSPADIAGLKVTYWYLANGVWHFSGLLDYTGNSINSPGSMIDDIRIFPEGCMMTTYNYEPGVGMICTSDPKDVVSFYEYDNLGRLKAIRDQDGNITRSYTYKFKGTE